MRLLSDGIVFGELGDDGAETGSGVESAGGLFQHLANELPDRRSAEEERAQQLHGENRKWAIERRPASDDPQRGQRRQLDSFRTARPIRGIDTEEYSITLR